MKKLILILIVLFFFNNTGISQSFPFLGGFFKSQNFQCGGFVTAVYPAGNPTNLGSQILYAKTVKNKCYKKITLIMIQILAIFTLIMIQIIQKTTLILCNV